jgi:hypothetical protein
MVATMTAGIQLSQQKNEPEWRSNKGMKQTKSTPWHSIGAAFAAYAQRSAHP